MNDEFSSTVIVPRDSYEKFGSALSKWKFFEVQNRPETVIGGRVTFTLLSDPSDLPHCNKQYYFDEGLR